MRRVVFALTLAGLLLWSVRAPANDEPDELLPGKTGGTQALDHAKFISDAGPFDLPNASNNPTIEGGSVRFFDTAPGGDDETYDLPAGNWAALGGDEYDYDPMGGPAPGLPCAHVRVRSDEIEVRCIGSGVTLTSPFAGDLGVILTIGTNSKRYCASMGGTTETNSSRKLVRHNSAPPGSCPTPPTPLPELLPGKVVIIRPSSFAKFVAKPPRGESFDLPSYPVNPKDNGATLRFRDTGGTGGDVTFSLPAGPQWTVAGKSGYKYHGLGVSGDPCKLVLIKSRVIKAVCVGTDVALTTGATFTGDVAVKLTTATGPFPRYCVQYGGDPISNSDTSLIRKNAPAPMETDCPSPSGAFLDPSLDPVD